MTKLVALVTGGTGAIGSEISKQLAELGYLDDIDNFVARRR